MTELHLLILYNRCFDLNSTIVVSPINIYFFVIKNNELNSKCEIILNYHTFLFYIRTYILIDEHKSCICLNRKYFWLMFINSSKIGIHFVDDTCCCRTK